MRRGELSNYEEFVVGRYPRIELFPLQQIADHLRHWVHLGLIQPRDDLFPRPAWEGERLSGTLKPGQSNQSRTPLHQQLPAG